YLAPRFNQWGKPKVTRLRKKARDPAMARRLWELSVELTGCDWQNSDAGEVSGRRLTGVGSRVNRCVTHTQTTIEPQLPAAHGPLSMAVRCNLTELAPRAQLTRI